MSLTLFGDQPSRSTSLQHRVASAAMALSLATGGAFADTITIDWDVELEIDSSVASGLGIDETLDQFRVVLDPLPGADGFIGLAMDLESSPTYRLNLPFQFTISAPDEVSAGQLVQLDVDYGFRPGATASFEASTEFAFDTRLIGELEGALVPDTSFNINLPDTIDLGFGGATLGGTDNDTTGTTAYTAASVGTPFGEDPPPPDGTNQVIDNLVGGPGGDAASVPVTGLSRFDGTAFQTPLEDDFGSDGWSVFGDLSGLLPGVVDAIIDLNIGAGLDPKEEATLSTGLLGASYADYVLNSDGTIDWLSGASSIFEDEYDYVVFNHINFEPALLIPDVLDVADDYRVQFGSLVSTFNIFSEIFLDPVAFLDIELNIPFVEDPSFRLFDFSIGDLLPVGSEYSAYYYQEFLASFLGVDEAFTKFLQFDIVEGLANDDVGRDLMVAELPSNLFNESIDTGDGLFGRVDVGVDKPSAIVEVQPVAVSEPSSFGLILAGLLALFASSARHRRPSEPGA